MADSAKPATPKTNIMAAVRSNRMSAPRSVRAIGFASRIGKSPSRAVTSARARSTQAIDRRGSPDVQDHGRAGTTGRTAGSQSAASRPRLVSPKTETNRADPSAPAIGVRYP